jgi:endoglucanase Acf2
MMVALFSVVVLIGGAGYLVLKSGSTPTRPFTNAAHIATLSQKEVSGIDTSHLADGVIPPTNKWFSGLALQKTPKTVFPTPLAFTPGESSFAISLPVITPLANTIFASRQQLMTIDIPGASAYQVTRYDELSVDLTYLKGKTPIGTVTITAGSPYIYFHAINNASLVLKSDSGITAESKVAIAATTASSRLVSAGFDGTSFASADGKVQAQIPADGLVTFYGLPSSLSGDLLLQRAGNRIAATHVSYQRSGGTYQTTIAFDTHNHKPTLFGLLPHQTVDSSVLFSLDTLYGQQRFYDTAKISFSVPATPLAASLDLRHVDDTEKALLIDTLRRDINSTKLGDLTDTYFGGKALYRSAQLLDLAKQLGEENIATSIQQKLHSELTTWLASGTGRANKYFYYDTKIHGIVGETVAFGSQEFNDHHFHYGYFIYAAAVLAKYDPDFKAEYAPMVNLLVADIANYRTGEQLPQRRMFDPYFGHSWASGSAPFDDGNNQESTSEAMNAWAATALWAQQTNNSDLSVEANWMLSTEVHAAKEYWLGFDTTQAPYDQYHHSLVSLNWGGKRDYATFFSASPAAMLGILLIPMNPTSVYLSAYGDRIETHIDEAIGKDANYKVQFGDYILMYNALKNKTAGIKNATSLPDEFIDGANSRSYMYAWIMSQG